MDTNSDIWYNHSQVRLPGFGWYRFRWGNIQWIGEVTTFFDSVVNKTGYRIPRASYWDGWKMVYLPDLFWKSLPSSDAPYTEEFFFTNVKLMNCPFCGKIPTIKPSCEAMGGGLLVNPRVDEFNTYTIQPCCSLIGWSRFSSLQKLQEVWNNRI